MQLSQVVVQYKVIWINGHSVDVNNDWQTSGNLQEQQLAIERYQKWYISLQNLFVNLKPINFKLSLQAANYHGQDKNPFYAAKFNSDSG